MMCSPIESLSCFPMSYYKLEKQLRTIATEELSNIGILNINTQCKIHQGTLRVDITGPLIYDHIASFSLRDFPACPYIGFSTDTYVVYKYQNKGISTILQKMKAAVAAHLEFNLLIATVRKNNEYEKASLLKNGWNKIDSFKQTYYPTHNEVEIWTKHFP